MNSLDSYTERIKAFSQLIRPRVMFLPVLCSWAVIIRDEGLKWNYLAITVLLLLISYGIVVILNNFADKKADILNSRTDITWINNVLSKNDQMSYLVFLFATGMVISLFVNTMVSVWFIFFISLGYLYSGKPKLKDRGFWGIIILAVSYGLMPWLLGNVTTLAPITANDQMIYLSSFLFVLGTIPLKDFKDYAGDKLTNKKTLLVMHGAAFVKKYLISITALSYLILVIAAACGQSPLLILAIAASSILTLISLNKMNLANRIHRIRIGSIVRTLYYLLAICLYVSI